MLKRILLSSNTWSNVKYFFTVVSIITAIALVGASILTFIDLRYNFAAQKWFSGYSCVSKFQSIYQLGAALLITFAFAGPKLADYFNSSRYTITRDIKNIAIMNNQIKYHDILLSLISLIDIYEQRWESFLMRRTLGYLLSGFIALVLLTFASFSSYRLPNIILLDSSIILLGLPFFQVLAISLEVSLINKSIGQIMLLGNSSNTAFDENNIINLQKIYKLLSKLDRSA